MSEKRYLITESQRKDLLEFLSNLSIKVGGNAYSFFQNLEEYKEKSNDTN